jgi:integrase
MKLRLDSKTIPTLALGRGQSEAFAWDSELAGFGLRLQGQRRTYVVQYRASGRSRRITLGPLERLTLTQARDAARRLLARVSLDDDPQEEKATKRLAAARTFHVVVNAYLAAKESGLRPISYKIAKLYLTGPYFRPLHAIGVNEIAHPDVAARLSAITRAHSSHTAAAARRAISALFRWAMEEGWAQANPVIGTRKPAEAKPRDRVLSDAELVAIWRTCGDDDFGRMVRLLILLGARRQEIGGLRWSELDLKAGTWTLPGERSKNHRPHTITLPPSARAIIGPALSCGRDHLFGARASRGFTAWGDGKAAFDRRLNGRVKPWRLHDIRRTVATRMADIGIEPHVIEAVLNHYSGHRAGPAGIYNRSGYERAVRAALIRWNEHVLALVEGRRSKVVALRT